MREIDFFKHKYPQSLWANQIVKALSSLNLASDTSVVDAPCGNGIIAYFVKRFFPKNEVYAFDLDERLMDSSYLKDSKVKINGKVADVFTERIPGNDNVWLLVNSLYCLPDIERLIEVNQSQFSRIICLVPNIESANFKWFSIRHPQFENPSVMTVKKTIEFFDKSGYELIDKSENTKIPFHKWTNLLTRLKFPLHVKNSVFNILDKLHFFGEYQYVLLILRRK